MYNDMDSNQAQLNIRCFPDTGSWREMFKVPLTYASSALEGGRLTEREIENLLAEGLPAGEAADWDHYEALGHARAYEYIYTVDKCKPVGEAHIKTMHRLLYALVDEQLGGAEQGGCYRQSRVRLAGAKYMTPAPADISAQMKDFADWLSQKENTLHPFDFAAQAHKRLIFIHPFMDGNRRIARLLMTLCLIRKGYPPAVILPAMRREYNALLENDCADDGEFRHFIAQRVAESQNRLLHKEASI